MDTFGHLHLPPAHLFWEFPGFLNLSILLYIQINLTDYIIEAKLYMPPILISLNDE